jgi:ribosomal protein S27AE
MEANVRGRWQNQVNGGEVEMLIKFKSCPRCNGALFVDWDQHGQYVECLQCGYLRDLRSQPHVERQLAEEEEEPALADY